MKKILFLLFATFACAAHGQTTYTIEAGLCSTHTSPVVSTTCGPSLVLDALGAVTEEVALVIAQSGVTLYQYSATGQNGTSTPVSANGSFSGGSIEYSFYTVKVRTGRNGYVLRTYMVGTLTK